MLCAFSEKAISELRSVTCPMGSHSVTYHSTQANALCLHPSQTSQYSIYLSLSWPWWWLYTDQVQAIAK